MLDEIRPDFVLKNLGGSCGLLSVYQLLLGGTHKIASALFVRRVLEKLITVVSDQVPAKRAEI